MIPSFTSNVGIHIKIQFGKERTLIFKHLRQLHSVGFVQLFLFLPSPSGTHWGRPAYAKMLLAPKVLAQLAQICRYCSIVGTICQRRKANIIEHPAPKIKEFLLPRIALTIQKIWIFCTVSRLQSPAQSTFTLKTQKTCKGRWKWHGMNFYITSLNDQWGAKDIAS